MKDDSQKCLTEYVLTFVHRCGTLILGRESCICDSLRIYPRLAVLWSQELHYVVRLGYPVWLELLLLRGTPLGSFFLGG